MHTTLADDVTTFEVTTMNLSPSIPTLCRYPANERWPRVGRLCARKASLADLHQRGEVWLHGEALSPSSWIDKGRDGVGGDVSPHSDRAEDPSTPPLVRTRLKPGVEPRISIHGAGQVLGTRSHNLHPPPSRVSACCFHFRY